MARPRRPRTPKEPKVPVVYEESSALREVANRLIRLYPVQFGWTSNFKIGFVLIRGKKINREAREPWGKFRKVPPIYHGLLGFDAIVEVLEAAWDLFNAEQQEAILAHELSHGSMSEKGALRVEKHDLEEFRFVVAQWGAWDDGVGGGIKEFGEQLDLFTARGPAIKTGTRGTQATLDAPTSAEVVEASHDAVLGDASAAGDDDALLPGEPAPASGQEPISAFRKPATDEPTPIRRTRTARPAAAPPLQ